MKAAVAGVMIAVVLVGTAAINHTPPAPVKIGNCIAPMTSKEKLEVTYDPEGKVLLCETFPRLTYGQASPARR